MDWTKKEVGIVVLLTAMFLFLGLTFLDLGLAFLRPSPDESDALLGWKLKENFRREFAQRTLGGRSYFASFATNGAGLRIFGSNDKAPVKILVLGDSFTADPYASNDRMWYVKMTERLAQHAHRPLRDFYVMAGGAGGWGTYQELLLLEQLSRTIHPDLFVLQFCSNDFQNNSYEWESQSVVRGQYMRRPYPSSNGPRYHVGLLAAAYRSFLGESHLLNRIDGIIGTTQRESWGGYIRPLPPGVEANYERDSIALTRSLLTRMRKIYPAIPAVMVNCDPDETGPNKSWKAIARDAGFVPISGPTDFLRSLRAEERLIYLNADGSHLSDEGNQRYGAAAGDQIAALGVIPLARP